VAVLLSACRLGFEHAAPLDAGAFAIGGALVGLMGSGLILQNNGGDDLVLDQNGEFWFATPVMDGHTYNVTLAVLPPGESCVVANAVGSVRGAVVASIIVTCFASGSCPTMPLVFQTDTTFTLPAGCTTVTVAAHGGGGAGGARNSGDAAAAGGAGGRAVITLTDQLPGTEYSLAIGRGGTCNSIASTPGGFTGGGGGNFNGGVGGTGQGASAPPGGLGGAGSSGTQPGGAGGSGGYGGGGGGGGGDGKRGNSGGGATTFQISGSPTAILIAGGGGGAGTADQNGDVSGAGGAACTGYEGAHGAAAVAGTRSGGGGGGGACACEDGSCDEVPTSAGGAGGAAGRLAACTTLQNGEPGRVVISFP
jgi:hypothetical protein